MKTLDLKHREAVGDILSEAVGEVRMVGKGEATLHLKVTNQVLEGVEIEKRRRYLLDASHVDELFLVGDGRALDKAAIRLRRWAREYVSWARGHTGGRFILAYGDEDGGLFFGVIPKQ